MLGIPSISEVGGPPCCPSPHLCLPVCLSSCLPSLSLSPIYLSPVSMSVPLLGEGSFSMAGGDELRRGWGGGGFGMARGGELRHGWGGGLWHGSFF